MRQTNNRPSTIRGHVDVLMKFIVDGIVIYDRCNNTSMLLLIYIVGYYCCLVHCIIDEVNKLRLINNS